MAARHDLLAQIGANRRRTIYLMAGFTIFVAGVAAVFDLAFAGGPVVLAVAIVVALAMVWTGYFYSDRVAIAVARGRPAEPEEYPRLHHLVERPSRQLSGQSARRAPPCGFGASVSPPSTHRPPSALRGGMAAIRTGSCAAAHTIEGREEPKPSYLR